MKCKMFIIAHSSVLVLLFLMLVLSSYSPLFLVQSTPQGHTPVQSCQLASARETPLPGSPWKSSSPEESAIASCIVELTSCSLAQSAVPLRPGERSARRNVPSLWFEGHSFTGEQGGAVSVEPLLAAAVAKKALLRTPGSFKHHARD